MLVLAEPGALGELASVEIDDDEVVVLRPDDMEMIGDLDELADDAADDDEDEDEPDRPKIRREKPSDLKMPFFELTCSFRMRMVRSTYGTRPRCKNSPINVRMRS